jgi:hypothetical protein
MTTTPIRSADVLVDQVEKTPGLLAKVKSNPVEALREVAKQVTASLPPPAYISDRWTYRIVVIALGLVCIASVLGAIYLSATATGTATVPDVLTALGAAAIGALAGLLAPSPSRS